MVKESHEWKIYICSKQTIEVLRLKNWGDWYTKQLFYFLFISITFTGSAEQFSDSNNQARYREFCTTHQLLMSQNHEHPLLIRSVFESILLTKKLISLVIYAFDIVICSFFSC